MKEKLLDETDSRMQKSVESFEREMVHIRTGRATPNLLDSIKVEYYGNEVPLNQVASVSIPEPRTIIIQPWEKQIAGAIEKAILKSNLGITPNNDGSIIRLSIPALTEERRKDLVRMIKKTAEDFRISVRNIRRDANEQLKKAEKASEISEDESKRLMDKVQKLTDENIEKIDKILDKKEKEILQSN
ncbi:ribosome recycling factor [bacterium]|nr:ribosome recycling factor [bacterium]